HHRHTIPTRRSSDLTQVANLASTERNWQDQYAESGTMYEYTLWAEGIYPIKRKFLNIIQGIGFRVPVGRVSGRVTYAGGTAVQRSEEHTSELQSREN